MNNFMESLKGVVANQKVKGGGDKGKKKMQFYVYG